MPKLAPAGVDCVAYMMVEFEICCKGSNFSYGAAKPEFRRLRAASQQAARQPVGPQRLRAVALSAKARGTSERIFRLGS